MDQILKNQRFRESMRALDEAYSPFEVARWFCLGEESTVMRRRTRGPINRKLYEDGHKDHRGATTNDVLCAQLMQFLHNKGYDLGSMEFDDQGHLLGIKKRPSIKKQANAAG